jgi:putative hydrolase
MPFFGDIGRMFSSGGPVSWDVAKQLATWLATDGQPEDNVDPLERIHIEELGRVADLHVADTTGLSTSASGMLTVRAVGRADWALRSLEAYKPLLEALAVAMSPPPEPGDDPGAEVDAADPMSGLLGNLAQVMSPMLLGMQSGSMVGHLSKRALGQYDFPIPRPPADELLVVPANIDGFAEDWSLPPDDVRLWVLLTETTVHAVFSRPHVRAAIELLLRDYVAGFRPDPSALETKLAEVDPADPASLQRALGDPEALLGAMQTPEQRVTLERLKALTCALVGYVDWVLDTTGRRLIASFDPLSEALRRRRVQRGDGDRFAEQLFGLSLGQAEYDRGAAFVRGIVERAGETGLSRLWGDEADLPTPPELDAPGLWLARIDLGESR